VSEQGGTVQRIDIQDFPLSKLSVEAIKCWACSAPISLPWGTVLLECSEVPKEVAPIVEKLVAMLESKPICWECWVKFIEVLRCFYRAEGDLKALAVLLTAAG